jgi:hypothetical protein
MAYFGRCIDDIGQGSHPIRRGKANLCWEAAERWTALADCNIKEESTLHLVGPEA